MHKRKVLAVHLLLAMLVVIGCTPHRVGGTQPVTTWERVNSANAQIALANNSVAQAVIAVNQGGYLSNDYTAKITGDQVHIAQWQRQLTPMLKDAATAKTNSAAIQTLLDNLAKAGASMVASGNAGITDRQQAGELATNISSVQTNIDQLIDLLRQAGVVH